MKIDIPKLVHPFLWSYDISKLDMERDKKRIITNVLNAGTTQATDWLFSVFKKEDILATIRNPLPGEWNKKSLHFWALVLDIQAGDTARKIS